VVWGGWNKRNSPARRRRSQASLHLCGPTSSSGGIEAGFENGLGFESELGPIVVESSRANLTGKVADQAGFLSAIVAVTMLGNSRAAHVRFHFEIAAGFDEFVAMNFESDFVTSERYDEIFDVQITLLPADISPLLVLGQE
jgi:hypothetical protein